MGKGNGSQVASIKEADVLRYLELCKVNVKKDNPILKARVGEILNVVKEFDPLNPAHRVKLQVLLANAPINLNFDKQEIMVMFLTRYTYSELDELVTSQKTESEAQHGDGGEGRPADTTPKKKAGETIDEDTTPVSKNGNDAPQGPKKGAETREGEDRSGDSVPVPKKEFTIEDARQVVNKVGDAVRHPINTVANISIKDMWVNGILAAWTTRNLPTETVPGTVLKHLAFATEVVVGTAALPTITGVVLGARLARFGIKGINKVLKGPKDKLAEAIHKKTLDRIKETKDTLMTDKVKWDKVYASAQKSVNDRFAELGDISSDSQLAQVYQMISDSRESKEENQGEAGKKVPSIEECQDAIGQAYEEETAKRDSALFRVMNQDVLATLKEKTNLPQDVLWEMISTDSVSFDEQGKLKLEIPDGYPQDIKNKIQKEFSKFDTEELKTLMTKVRERDTALEVISESDRQAIFASIKYSDGVITIDDSKLSDRSKGLVVGLNGLKITDREKFEKLSSQIQQSHSVIDFLVECEQEVLSKVAVQTNESMIRTVEKTEQEQQQQKGLFRSIGRRLVSNGLRDRAEHAVENRSQKTINETVARSGDIATSFIALAQERLGVKNQAVENEIAKEQAKRKETPQPEEHSSGGRE